MFNNKIDVAKGFQTSVNIAYDLNNTDKISGSVSYTHLWRIYMRIMRPCLRPIGTS